MKYSLKYFKTILGVALFLLLLTDTALGGNPINGKIEVEGGKRLRNIIVFLESTNPGFVSPKSRKHKVTQKGRAFNPPLLVVSKEDSVQWLNDEDREIDHNVYSLSKVKNFDLGLGDKGSILEQAFHSEGRLNYFCSVHKTMEGRLVVLPNRYFMVLKKPGNFILPDIPPGSWMIKAVVFHRRFKAQPVKVSVGSEPIKDVILKIVKR